MKKKQYKECIEFGSKVRALRKEKHITMKELGKRVGLHESTIARYENGEISAISIEITKAFAEVLGTTPEFLSGWDTDIAVDDNIQLMDNVPNNHDNKIDELDLTSSEMQEVYEYAVYIKSKRESK